MQLTNLNEGWIAARASDVQLSGQDLTTSHFPSLKTGLWMKAVVPGTVLTTLLENELIPDPFYGLNNLEVPDIADVGREYYTFWFCNRFKLPSVPKGGKVCLNFRAVNYQAEVFLNGFSKLLSKGMFLRHTIDITDWLDTDGENLLAVLVHPPDHPGRIPLEGGQGGDHDPKGGKVCLNFRAVNYQAEVFLNGFSKLLSKGMFLRHTIDITDWLDTDGENLLAVLVHPPDHPGRIPLEGGQGGDHDPKGGKVCLNFRAVNYQAEVFLNGFSKLLSKGMFLRHTIDITDWLDTDGENLLAVLVHPPDHPGRIPLEGGQGGDHDPKGGKVCLNFRAVNYQAEVFLNGFSKLLSKGMFLRHTIDITDWLDTDGENLLAVLVHPPDHPGRIPLEGGQGGDHDIAKDVAAQYVEGWDWICPIRDRNTGIWDAVSIHQTGPVRLVDPHLVATFHHSYAEADLWVTTELVNTSSKQLTVSIKLNVSLDDVDDFCIVDHVHTSQDIVIEGNSTMSYSLPPLLFKNPALWWCNGLGDQPLYKVDITLDVQGYGEADCWSHLFGFRHIESYIDPATNGRKFTVNGEPVYIRGGNWIVSDGLLRLSKDRYETEVNFHADMNLNMIRIWGGALAERPEFYTACDKRGVLVWQEFWITGDCNGRGVEPSDPDWPLDHNLFLTCADDTVKLLRNHSSLSIWCGGNEQHPAKDINESLEKKLKIASGNENPSTYLDGTRLYIKGSLWEGIAAGNGLFRDGPYGIQVPEKFFEKDYYPYAFNPEIGNVGVPKAETIRATMPSEAWDPPVCLNGEYPNETWDYHKYIPYADAQKLVPGQIEAFGVFNGLDDFCEKAQLVNYVQYRALIEGWNSWMWTKYTGVILWKTQNPWPGLRGQMYDFLLDQTGAFFGLRSACESVHVQLNLLTYDIEIVNTRRESMSDCVVEASVFDVNGENPYSHMFKGLGVPAKTTSTIGNIPLFTSINDHPMYFLLLKCLSSSGKLISRNFYWLHPVGGSYTQLAGEFRIYKVPITTSTSCIVDSGDSYNFNVRVANMNPAVAFGLYFTVIDAADPGALENRILPVTYSDNWFSLVPNEAFNLKISFKVRNNHVRPKLLLRGWNVADTVVDFHD